MKTKLPERVTLSLSQCCKCGPSYTKNRHRQLGMQTNWWTVKETFSVSSVICNLFHHLRRCRWWRVHPDPSLFLFHSPPVILWRLTFLTFHKAFKCTCEILAANTQFTASHLKLERIQLKEEDRAAGIHLCSS